MQRHGNVLSLNLLHSFLLVSSLFHVKLVLSPHGPQITASCPSPDGRVQCLSTEERDSLKIKVRTMPAPVPPGLATAWESASEMPR